MSLQSDLQQKINETLYTLAKTIIDALLEDQIGKDTAKFLAKEILKLKENISTEQDLEKFLYEVKYLHPIFEKEIEFKELKEAAKKQDSEKIEEIKNKLLELTKNHV